MKKIISLVLLVVMVLSLCACGGIPAGDTGETTGGEHTTAAASGVEGFQVGYSKVNITPTYSVPLAGYGNTSMRMSQGFTDYLYTTCIALSDGENTVLVYHNDLIGSRDALVNPVRKAVKGATGVPEENIMISATHMHSGPDLGNGDSSIVTYTRELIEWMTEAAEEALEDLKPATAWYGSCNPVGLNFIRHYLTEEGNVIGDNFGEQYTDPVVGHHHEADNLMQVVKFDREDGQDVVLINWQTHPHRAGGGTKYNMTSDIVGTMRDAMEDEGYLFTYYTGASGNVNPSSRIKENNVTSDYKEQGQKMAEYALDVLGQEMTSIALGKLQVLKNTYTGKINHTEDDKAPIASKIAQEYAANNNRSACVQMGLPYGINSPYHAAAIVNKSSMGLTADIAYSGFSMGDLAFVFAPYEMFDTNGLFIKDKSPFKHTFVVTCANGANGYLPSEEAYAYSCYEANTGKFAPGIGEQMAQNFVDLLNELYKTK